MGLWPYNTIAQRDDESWRDYSERRYRWSGNCARAEQRFVNAVKELFAELRRAGFDFVRVNGDSGDMPDPCYAYAYGYRSGWAEAAERQRFHFYIGGELPNELLRDVVTAALLRAGLAFVSEYNNGFTALSPLAVKLERERHERSAAIHERELALGVELDVYYDRVEVTDDPLSAERRASDERELAFDRECLARIFEPDWYELYEAEWAATLDEAYADNERLIASRRRTAIAGLLASANRALAAGLSVPEVLAAIDGWAGR